MAHLPTKIFKAGNRRLSLELLGQDPRRTELMQIRYNGNRTAMDYTATLYIPLSWPAVLFREDIFTHLNTVHQIFML